MSGPSPSGTLTAILPCNDLDVPERFYNRLGFTRPDTKNHLAGRDMVVFPLVERGSLR
jgi:hypothetical protein